MQSDDVAHYLSLHPEFFDNHPHLLTDVRVQHPFEGRAISITERQIFNLREKNLELEKRLADFVQFGAENDLIAARMHLMAVDLISAGDLSDLLAVVYFHLQQHFDLPHVLVRLWYPYQQIVECAPCEQSIVDWVENMPEPQCGVMLHPDALNWLGDTMQASFATIPLRYEQVCYGVVILVSDDATRFSPTMGTLYLQHMSQMIAATLLRITSA